jgi:hypothetical protein
MEDKVLLTSSKNLPVLILKNPSSNPLQRACCGVLKPACYCKTDSVTRMSDGRARVQFSTEDLKTDSTIFKNSFCKDANLLTGEKQRGEI